jgi:hypothetical protein
MLSQTNKTTKDCSQLLNVEKIYWIVMSNLPCLTRFLWVTYLAWLDSYDELPTLHD